MKKLNFQPVVILLSLFTLGLISFSFSVKYVTKSSFGGEGFEIYLNDKLIVQRYGNDMNSIKTIQLDQSVSNGQLAIRYYHCGRPGKSRVITIKDEQNTVLKQWKFGDAKDASAKVCCNVKDILALPKLKTGKKVSLYYASTEIPNGRELVTLTATGKAVAALP